MTFAYSIKDLGAVHFVTFTVHQWADVFTHQLYIKEWRLFSRLSLLFFKLI